VNQNRYRTYLSESLWIGCAIIWIGIVRIFIVIENVTLDGEKPIAAYYRLFNETALLYVSSGVLATLTIFLARKRIAIVGIFIFGSVCWSVYVIFSLSSGLNCTYWHHGDVLCDLDNQVGALALLIDAMNILLGLSLFWRKTKPYKLEVGILLSAAQNIVLLLAFMSV